MIDDKVLDEDDFTIDDEESKVTLSEAFATRLQEVEHTVRIVFNDGSASGTFTITPIDDGTGDDESDTDVIDYKIDFVDNDTVIKGEVISFNVNISNENCSGLKVDGENVAEEYFLKQEDDDDTIIMLYTDWLSVGNHTITVLTADDGEAEATFTVKEGITYELEGDGTTIIKGEKAVFSVKDATDKKLKYIAIDAENVDISNFELGEDDNNYTLSSEYIEGLDTGYHVITIVMEDGKASGTFGVKASTDEHLDDEHVYEQSITPATQSEDGKITYTCECGDSYDEVIAKISTVELSDTNYTYDGEEKNPTITVEDSKENSLVEGDDYTVTVPEGRTSAGKYTYSIEFKGKYEGTASLEFEIVSDEDPTDNPTVDQKTFDKVTLSATSYTYNGKAKEPEVTVLDADGNTVDASNYSVTYKNNKNVGTATVTITGAGDFAGSNITKTFTIKPAKTSITKLSKARKAFTVKWSKKSTQVTGYQIQYSTSSKFTSKTTKTTTVKSYKTTSKKIKKLKAKKKYYVRVRTYKTVSGKKYYSDWSSVKSVKTK